jgi:hypothetical protein
MLNDDAIRGIAALDSELGRLADEVVGMAQAVDLLEHRHAAPR